MKYKIEQCPFRHLGKPLEKWLVAYNKSIINTNLATETGPLDNLKGCVARRIVKEANEYEEKHYKGKDDRFHFRVKEMS